MDSPLKDFFRHERDRVITPGPFFSKRVMELVRELHARPEIDYGLWDVVADLTRPVFAVALVVILGFLAVEVFIPVVPERGMLETWLEVDQTPGGESLLYSGTELPDREELFVEMMGLGEQ
jgi:hypothetical protein